MFPLVCLGRAWTIGEKYRYFTGRNGLLVGLIERGGLPEQAALSKKLDSSTVIWIGAGQSAANGISSLIARESMVIR